MEGFPDRLCGPTTVLSNGYNQWRTEGAFGASTPPPEIPKALYNRAK